MKFSMKNLVEKFLESFESYCRKNFRGSRNLWIGELENHLSGKTLEGFRTLRHFEDGYDAIKKRLVNWHKDSNAYRKRKSKKKFENAKKKPDEFVFV